MDYAKVCKVFSEVEGELGGYIHTGCAVAQIFYAEGKTKEEVGRVADAGWYHEWFDGLLRREYGFTQQDCEDMYTINDRHQRSDRLAAVLAHYEALLAEQIIAESVVVEQPEYSIVQ